MPRKKKSGDEVITGEIVSSSDGDYSVDLHNMSGEELTRQIQIADLQLRRRQLQLANLEITEAEVGLHSRHRELMLHKYIEEIAALDRRTPGGLKSVKPEVDDDPALVEEAWRIYVQRQRGGGSRFG